MHFGMASLQLLWNRISFSRLTFFYFLFSLAHFIIQVSFQLKVFKINANAARFLTRIVTEAQTTNRSLPFLDDSTLRMCSWVPSNLDVNIPSCPIIWDGDQDVLKFIEPHSLHASRSTSTPVSAVATLSVSSSSFATSKTSSTTVGGQRTSTSFVPLQPTTVINDSFDTTLNNVSVSEEAGGDVHNTRIKNPVILGESCLWSLNWPISVLSDTEREDVVFVAFQFWVLGMSIVALSNESIPHIIASLVTHMMATAWAVFQIAHTANFQSNFNRVIRNGACEGVSLLPDYWRARSQAEVPSLTLNVIALFVSGFLTRKLIKLFGWQTFKRIGASLTINRTYKLVLTLSITIQLSLFFMAVSVSLWIDQLMNNLIGNLTEFQTLYKVSSFITLALLIPWLMTGWFAVHRELRVPMLIFLILSMLYLAGWSVIFFSTTFRWTFMTWTFFSFIATVSVVLTLLSAILGVVCRLNFGKGLARYLNPHQELDGDASYYSDGYTDIKRVAFPTYGQSVLTYAGDFKPTYSQPFSPYKPQGIVAHTEHGVTFPGAVLQRNMTGVQVHRNNSHESTRSLDNSHSACRNGSSHSRNESQASHTSHTKRWVIE